MKNQETLETLWQIAKSFPQESQEAKALEVACHALVFVDCQETRTRFEHFIKTKDRPLNGLELVQLKVYGLDIPDEAKTPEIMELASEIDAIAAKLRGEKRWVS